MSEPICSVPLRPKRTLRRLVMTAWLIATVPAAIGLTAAMGLPPPHFSQGLIMGGFMEAIVVAPLAWTVDRQMRGVGPAEATMRKMRRVVRRGREDAVTRAYGVKGDGVARQLSQIPQNLPYPVAVTRVVVGAQCKTVQVVELKGTDQPAVAYEAPVDVGRVRRNRIYGRVGTFHPIPSQSVDPSLRGYIQEAFTPPPAQPVPTFNL